MGYGYCKGCGKKILWIKTPDGKFIPCDPEEVRYNPDTQSGMILVKPSGELVRARAANSEAYYGIGYVTHWSTCQHADQFRKK